MRDFINLVTLQDEFAGLMPYFGPHLIVGCSYTNRIMSGSPSHAKDILGTSSKTPHSPRVAKHGSPITTLPVELLLTIFCLGDPEVTARLRLTHTCRRWRFIATEAASLWTYIKLIIGPSSDIPARDKRISLLEMQLDRAGDLLLDVGWLGNVADYYNTRILDLIHEKAPFSRWRTLELNLLAGEIALPEDVIFRSSDIFTNLESLTVMSRGFIPLYQRIGQKTTSRLRVFDVGPGQNSLADISHRFSEVLCNISSLVLHSQDNHVTTSSLPANIKEFQTYGRQTHLFPHIRTYHVGLCIFAPNRGIDLRSLTTLTVTYMLALFMECQVILPSLLHFAHGIISLSSGAKIQLPSLETLRILAGTGAGNDAARSTGVYDALHNLGYLVSPKNSLVVDLCLPEETMLLLLEKSPHVKHCALTFKDKHCARKVMKEIVEGGTIKGSRYRSSKRLCPELSELRMNFEWEVGDLVLWKGRSSKAVETRKEGGPRLSIWASWKGEGTYVALT